MRHGQRIGTFERSGRHGDDPLPAVGYDAAQLEALRETINRSDAEVVVVATPLDLVALITLDRPVVRARYEFADAGEPTLGTFVDRFLAERAARRLNVTFAPGMPQAGSIAFMSHSGALAVAILDWARDRRMGFPLFASLGNQADITESDVLCAVATDERRRNGNGEGRGIDAWSRAGGREWRKRRSPP